MCLWDLSSYWGPQISVAHTLQLPGVPGAHPRAVPAPMLLGGGICSLPEAEVALLARVTQCELLPNPRQPRSPPHPDASPLSPQHDGVFPGRTQREPVGDPHRPRAPAAPSH